jgi:hypothetical protein
VKLPTPRDRDEGLTLIAAAVNEARAVLQPWECDGLAALTRCGSPAPYCESIRGSKRG